MLQIPLVDYKYVFAFLSQGYSALQCCENGIYASLPVLHLNALKHIVPYGQNVFKLLTRVT